MLKEPYAERWVATKPSWPAARVNGWLVGAGGGRGGSECRFAHLPGAWLIVPTYNEAENLEAVASEVLAALAAADDDPHLLVVDDDSPDGTGRIADRLAAADARIHVLHNGPKRGLGHAYLTGFRYALDHGAELLLEMDADFSHDPADIPRLIERSATADLVLGSRYVPGGQVFDWGAGRRLLSRGGSLYARAILGLPIRDLTGGFKCFRREVLTTLDLDAVRANGYVFQIEMTFRAARAGFTVAEVPIAFRDRRAGRSKMSAAVAVEAIWRVPALRGRMLLESRRTRG